MKKCLKFVFGLQKYFTCSISSEEAIEQAIVPSMIGFSGGKRTFLDFSNEEWKDASVPYYQNKLTRQFRSIQ